jgi:type II secretory pathway pseudopilin PulG
MKIKISKKVLVIIGIVIFAIVLGSLVRTYSQQATEQGELSASLAAQQTLLNKLTADKKDWEDKRDQAESLLNTSLAKFPQSVESIQYSDDLFEIADDCNLSLTDLRPSKPSTKTAGAATYSVATFTLQVTGEVDNILDFIYAIRTGDDFELPWSAEVKAVNIAIGSLETKADITLDIYAYKR